MRRPIRHLLFGLVLGMSTLPSLVARAEPPPPLAPAAGRDPPRRQSRHRSKSSGAQGCSRVAWRSPPRERRDLLRHTLRAGWRLPIIPWRVLWSRAELGRRHAHPGCLADRGQYPDDLLWPAQDRESPRPDGGRRSHLDAPAGGTADDDPQPRGHFAAGAISAAFGVGQIGGLRRLPLRIRRLRQHGWPLRGSRLHAGDWRRGLRCSRHSDAGRRCSEASNRTISRRRAGHPSNLRRSGSAALRWTF